MAKINVEVPESDIADAARKELKTLRSKVTRLENKLLEKEREVIKYKNKIDSFNSAFELFDQMASNLGYFHNQDDPYGW